VVERYVRPQRRVVAGGTIRRGKGCSSGGVCRIVGLLPGGQVTPGIPAVIWLNRQCRIVPHMALVAARHLPGRRNLMRVRQRETGVCVIERGIRPQNRVMALRAQRSRETRRNVIRYRPAKCRRAVPGCLMAAVTVRVRARERVVVVDVAIGAEVDFARRSQLMGTHQRPPRRSMVEGYIGPQRGTVARRAVRRRERRSRRRVCRVIGLLPGRQVASGIPAVIRLNRQIVIVVDMAVRTGVHFARRRHLV